MEDNIIIVVPLLFVLFISFLLLWLIIWEPQIEQARAGRERSVEEERTGAERQRLAENERASAERQRLAEEERVRAEHKRLAEEKRVRVERQRLAEEERARADRERLAEEERPRTDRERLEDERDELLRSRRVAAPGFILREAFDFEREYRSTGGNGFFGQEMSPLACFGYRVGITRGRNNSERQAILKYAIVANFDSMLSFLPADYLSDWGSPLSLNRFNRIYHHLTSMADLRDGRCGYENAILDWRNDANWFKTDHKELVYKYCMI